MHNERGSEANKGALRSYFTAMRIWNGCSPLFFTLNPYARQPLTNALCNGEHFHVEHFSLDWLDEETISLAFTLARMPASDSDIFDHSSMIFEEIVVGFHSVHACTVRPRPSHPSHPSMSVPSRPRPTHLSRPFRPFIPSCS